MGTGLVEFAGGLLTSVLAFFFLLRLSPLMTFLTAAVVVAYSLVLQRAFQTLRPIFRERGKITAEVTGRLTETLGGIRGGEGLSRRGPGGCRFHRGRGADPGQHPEIV